MPDSSSADPEAVPPTTSETSISGGVNLDAQRDVNIGGDVVGRDKITTIGYTVEQVSTLLTQISGTFQPKPFDGRCPYLGLDAFSEDDADRFFGREKLVSELVERVKVSRFVVIAGPSGSGKSSLVRAGLIHALKHGALPNSDRWLYATLTPGRAPIESLALALSRLAKSPEAGKYLRDHFAEPSALYEFAESQLGDHPDQRTVIFVDQFEEIFTQVSKEDERVAFLNLLTHAATLEHGRVTLLFAMRSDFVSNCATYPQLNALLNQQFMQVGAMQSDELVSAIAQPALQVGLRIDPDLIAQIVNDMQDEPGALPLMQFALKDLFDAQHAIGGVIALTLNDYLARGGLRKALERHADAAFAKLNADEQHLAHTIFSGLIEIGRGTQDTRRTAAFDELVPVNVTAVQVEAVIQKLADARLITTGEQGDKDTVTISHERLIGAWPWLQRLVNENREVIALQNQIAEDAQEWAAHHRDMSYLYAGARLATAREQLSAKKIVLSGLAHGFVTASVEAEEAERRQEEARRQKELDDARRLAESEKQRAEEQARSAARLRRRAVYLLGALGIALVLGVLAGVFGVQSSQNADTANRNAAKAEAASTLAVANARTAEAASTQAVSEANIRATAESNANQQRDEAQRQAAIADSRRLAALALNNTAMDGTEPDYPVRTLALHLARTAVERAHTDEAENALREAVRLSQPEFTLGEAGSGSLRDVRFSPDGRRVAVVQAETAQNVWMFDLDSGELAARITLSDDVTSLVFTPDGQGVATLGPDGVVRVWDVGASQEQERSRWDAAGVGVTAMMYSPDGRQLLIVGKDSVPRLLDAGDGHVLTVGPRLNGNVSQMMFSSDGKRIVTVADGRDVRLWATTTGVPLAEIVGSASGGNGTANNGNVMAVQLAPNGERVLFVTDRGLLQQWTAATQQTTVLQDFGFTPIAAAFSNDGARLGLLEYGLTVYALDTGRMLVAAEADENATRLAFSPDNQRLITFGYNARLWDARSGQPLAEIDGGHAFPSGSAAMVDAAFSPDSQVVGLYGEGYTYPVMRFEPVYMDCLLEWSRRLAPGELTCEQQVEYQISDEVCSTPTATPTRVIQVTPTP